MDSNTKFCSSCHSFTSGKKETRGHFAIEVFMWLLLIIPGIIYSVWRQSSKHITCSQCGASNLIAFNAPKAKKELGQDYEGNLADFEAHAPARRKQLYERLSSTTVMLLLAGAIFGIPLFLALWDVYPKTTLLLIAFGVGFYFFKKKKSI